MMSLVIPVYKNAGNVPPLLEALSRLNEELDDALEVVFVVDGSPDESALLLRQALPTVAFRSQLLLLSRNFGAFSAIRAGLAQSSGEYIAVMAADLQEPPELVKSFREKLATGEYDVVLGTRAERQDPLSTRLFSSTFWAFYRRFIQRDVPPGGVDVFACTRSVRDQLLQLTEINSSLVGQLFWVGFRRCLLPYERRRREVGISAWTIRKKMNYLLDSIFSFSDLPIRLLLLVGGVGLILSVAVSIVVLAAKILGTISVPGYAATVLIVTFFGALNCLGLGVVGGYVWRTFENTKGRPNYIVLSHDTFGGS